MYPEIEITFPDGRTERVTLTRPRLVVGRSTSADIHINDSRISREHCEIEVSNGQVYVKDLGGSNGTWIGKTKLLANVRETFPLDSIVYVGPAQLKRVPPVERVDPANDLESQVFSPVPVPPPRRAGGRDSGGRDSGGRDSGGRDSGGRGGSPYGGRTVRDGSEALLEVPREPVAVSPGERASIEILIANQGKIVDHYTVVVTGVPSTWVTVPREGLELLPRQEGTIPIDIHPPRTSRTSAGNHRMTIAVKNQVGRVVTEAASELNITPFDNLSLEVRPNPYKSRSGGRLTLTVRNDGNARTDYRVDVIEPSDSLDVTVEPQTADLAPQQARTNLIRLRPRKRNWVGDAKHMTLNITVSTSLDSKDTTATYIQTSTIPRWLPVLLTLACCVILPFLALFAWQTAWPIAEPILFPTETVAPTATAENTPTATIDVPATITATFEAWLLADDDNDGLTNGEEKNEYNTRTDIRDTDGDGLSDFDEVTRYDTQPTDEDSDGDTISDGDEVAGCTSPNKDDTDGDGIPDNVDNEPCAQVTATPVPATPVPGFAYGAHVAEADSETLGTMQDARMEWVKIQVHFSPGDDPASAAQDASAIKQEGFKILLGVVGSKEGISQGVSYFNQYAQFVAGLASVADAIEVWNEPNIEREWPRGEISPGTYTELLRISYNAIKAADPSTIVISGAPAPTGVNNDGVMSDDRFIAGMMAAGAKNYMDCAGMHFNQGATPPAESSGHPDGNHYSYYFLDILDLYWETFNPPDDPNQVSLCFTEIGFLTDDGFDKTLAQVGATGFLWAEGTSEFDQAVWLADALSRSCESSRVKIFIVWNMNFKEYGQDPQAGYALVRPDGDCPACERLAETVGRLRGQNCMR